MEQTKTDEQLPSLPKLPEKPTRKPRRWLRWLALGAVVLALALGVTLWNLEGLLKANKDVVFSGVESALGRPLQAKEFDVSVWGGIGFHLTDVRLADAPEFSEGSFLEAESITLKVAFLPLLKKQLTIDRLSLDHPRLVLIRNDDGAWNYESFSAPSTGEESTEPAETEAESGGAPLLIQISELDIRGGEVIVRDSGDDTPYPLRNIDLSARDVGIERPIVLDFSAEIGPDASLCALEGTVGPLGETFDLSKIRTRLALQIDDINLENTLTTLRKHVALEAWPSDLLVQGPLSLGVELEGLLNDLDVRANLEAERANIEYGELFTKPQGMRCDLNAALHLAPTGEFQSSKGELHLGRLTTEFSGDIELSDPIRVRVDLNVSDSDLRELATVLPIVKPYALEGEIELDAKIDGKVSVDEPPSVKGTLRLNGVAVAIPDTGTELKQLTAALDMDGDRFSLKKSEFNVTYPPRIDDLAVELRGDLRLEAKTVHLENGHLESAPGGIDISGQVERAAPYKAQFTLHTPGVALSGWEAFFPEVAAYALGGSIALDADLSAALDAPERATAKGTLQLKDVSVTPPGSPQPLSGLNAQVAFTEKQLDIPDAAFNLGRSPVKLTAKAGGPSPLSLTYRVESPEFQVGDWLEPTDKDAPPELLRDLQTSGEMQMDKGIEDLRWKGSITLPEGRAAAVDLKELSTSLSLREGVLTIDSFAGKVFDAPLTVEGKYALLATPAKFDTKGSITGFDLGSYAKASDPGSDPKFLGRLNMEWTLAGAGTSWPDIQPTLQGKSQLEVTDGVWKGVNIVQKVLSPLTGVPGLSLVFKPIVDNSLVGVLALPDTQFQEIRSAIRIGEEKATIESFRMKADEFMLTSNGWVGFDQKLDVDAILTLAPGVLTSLKSKVSEASVLEDPNGKPRGIPFKATGTLSDMSVVPDVSSMAWGVPGQILEAAGVVGEGVGEGVREVLGGLKGLMGGSRKKTKKDE